jgi:p-cymene monooxygenase
MFFDYARYYLTFGLQLMTAAGLLLGGAWAWLGLSTLFVFAVADELLPLDLAPRRMNNQALASVPLWLCTLSGPLLVLLLAWTAAQGNFAGLDWAGAVISTAWLSVIGYVPSSHELYHQRSWLAQFVGNYGQVVYLDCTRSVGHTVGHHIDVGTKEDSDTAPRGKDLYSFTLKALVDSTILSSKIESDALEKRGYSRWSWRHRAWKAVLAQLVFHAVAFAIAGWTGVAAALASMLVARLWVESFNYFQHYGIVRAPGKPVARRHLWNHLGYLTRPVAMEITNHADHHLDSYIPYYKLQPDPTAIRMPNVFLCFLAALVPPLWHRYIIMPALKEWDLKFASAEEREIARAQNLAAGWPDWFSEAPQQGVAA